MIVTYSAIRSAVSKRHRCEEVHSIEDPLLQEPDSAQAKQVLDELLRPKTKPLGVQVYLRSQTEDNDKDEK